MTLDLARGPDGTFQLTPEQGRAADEAVQSLVLHNDVARLTPAQRVGWFLRRCADAGLSPYSTPFDFLTLDGRIVAYPNARCAEQLRRLHQISIKVLRREDVGELHVVEVEARTPSGRTDTASKWVPIVGYGRDGKQYPLRGQKLADAYAKAETGAKRRVTFSLGGLGGMPDMEDTAGARRVYLDADGNIVEHPSEEQRYLIEHPRAARAAGYRTLADGDITAAPLPGIDQTPRPDDLAPPERPDGPHPTFKPSAEERERWRKQWLAMAHGTMYGDDDGRHTFFRQWTGGRTQSSVDFFATATKAQAEECLAHTRVITDEEKNAILHGDATNAADEIGEDERPF
jgi:hypothetical protein